MRADRQRNTDGFGLDVAARDPGDATTATAVPSPLDRVPVTTSGNATADDAETWSWQRECEPDHRSIGARLGAIRRRVELTVRALLSRDRYVPDLDVDDVRPLRYYLRRAIHDHIGHAVPPFAVAIDPSVLERYRRACGRLPLDDREQIVGLLELGYSYDQLALALGRSSRQAARSAAKRALLRLAEEMTRA